MSSYSPLPFLFFSLPSTLVAAPALSVTGEVRGARDVSRHKDIPAPNISWLMPNRPQSGGNLECSLKDTEMTWFLLTCCVGFFCDSAATSRKAPKIYLSHRSPYIGPSRSF